MAFCAKCFHRDVCKTCDSCDGYVPKCGHFIDKEELALEVYNLQKAVEDLRKETTRGRPEGTWKKWRPPQNMVMIGVDTLYCCSECTAKFVQTFRYCPHCGALMNKVV